MFVRERLELAADALRFVRVCAGAGLELLCSYVWCSASARLWPPRREAALARRREAVARWWSRMALQNGIVTRKCAQIFGGDEKLFPDALVRARLSRLCHDVERMPARDVDDLLKDAYAGEDWPFSHFERASLSSGCMAQVHEARLRADSARVAVKLFRRDIERRVERELRFVELLLKALLWALKHARPRAYGVARKTRLWERFQNIRRELLAQTCSKREVRNLERFREVCDAMRAMYVPRVYTDRCKPRVIVEEFVEGVPLAALRDASYNSVRAELCSHLMEFFLRSIFQLRESHGDLHKGNICYRTVMPARSDCDSCSDSDSDSDSERERERDGGGERKEAAEDRVTSRFVLFDLGLMNVKSDWELDALRAMIRLLGRRDWLGFIEQVYDMLLVYDCDPARESVHVVNVRVRVWTHIFRLIRSAVKQGRPTLGFFTQIFEFIAQQEHVRFRVCFNDLDVALVNMDHALKEIDPAYPTFYTLYDKVCAGDASGLVAREDAEDAEDAERGARDSEQWLRGEAVFDLPEPQIQDELRKRAQAFRFTVVPEHA